MHFCRFVDLSTFEVVGATPGASNSPIALVSGFVAEADGACARDPAAVLIGAYEAHGEALSAHVLGQYAAAIVDPTRRRLLLVQDSLGVRPLFFMKTNGGIWISSRLEHLEAHLPHPTIDDEYIADLLATGQVFSERTPWRGVERLFAGQSAVVNAGGAIRKLRPWAPGRPAKSAGQDAKATLVKLLGEAIRACLPAEGTIACELSGGLDLTTVLAFARTQRDVLAVTFASRLHPDEGDISHSQAAAEAFDVRRVVLDTDPCRLFDPHHAKSSGEPGSEMFAAKMAAYDALLRNHGVDVVLTGWAGDAVFGSPAALPHHLADGLAQGRPWDSISATTRWRDAFPGGPSWTRWFTSYALRTAWRWRRGFTLNSPEAPTVPMAWHDAMFARKMRLRQRARKRSTPRVATPGQQHLWQAVYQIAAMHAPSGRFNLAAETRHPLLHRPLVEYMLSLDSELRHSGRGDRILQRRALKGILPEAIRLRETKGGMAGRIERDLARDRELHRRLRDAPRLVAGGYLDAAGWRALLQRAQVGAIEHRLYFDLTVSLELWLQNHPGQPPTPR